MLVILDLLRGVDADARVEFPSGAIGRGCRDLERATVREVLLEQIAEAGAAGSRSQCRSDFPHSSPRAARTSNSLLAKSASPNRGAGLSAL